MATAGGPKIKRDGLVFGYDTGRNPSSNFDHTLKQRRFFKGEPTTNLYTNPTFSNGTTGWSFGSWDGNVSYTTSTISGPFGTPITALTLTKNASSAYSHFHQGHGGDYYSGNTYTMSAWVKGYGTLSGRAQWGGVTNFTLNGDWQHVSYTSTTNSNIQYPYWAAENLTTGTTFYMTYAQSEQKSNPTPFTDGTRSSTSALIDLTKSTNIDVSNASFDSDGLMTFDGTDDIIYTGLFSGRNPSTDPFTIEAIVKSDVTSGNRMWIDSTSNGTNQRFYSSLNDGNGQPIGIQASAWSDSVPNTTNFLHQVIVMDGSTARAYLNGVENYTKAYTSYTLPGQIILGGRSGYMWIGQIPVFKVYQRALSATEIKENFKAYKNRFNL